MQDVQQQQQQLVDNTQPVRPSVHCVTPILDGEAKLMSFAPHRCPGIRRGWFPIADQHQQQQSVAVIKANLHIYLFTCSAPWTVNNS